MPTQTLADQIAAVNAYADYLQGAYRTRDGSQFPTHNTAVVALCTAAQAVLRVVDTWPMLQRRDRTHLVLQAPDGTRVLYSFVEGAERLTMVTSGVAIT